MGSFYLAVVVLGVALVQAELAPGMTANNPIFQYWGYVLPPLDILS